MKALIFKRYGRSPEIGFSDVPRPTPKPDELLVQVHAAGLNPIDNMILQGTFNPSCTFTPATLGSDLAGAGRQDTCKAAQASGGTALFVPVLSTGLILPVETDRPVTAFRPSI
jgi:D-arabinose 1-dehydrogenase-like Zn-dependent alcohol dehydrogenase